MILGVDKRDFIYYIKVVCKSMEPARALPWHYSLITIDRFQLSVRTLALNSIERTQNRSFHLCKINGEYNAKERRLSSYHRPNL